MFIQLLASVITTTVIKVNIVIGIVQYKITNKYMEHLTRV